MIAMALIARTGWIQFYDGERLQKEAIEQQTRDRMINSRRGTIYDRNGKTLAISASVETVTANPNEIREAGNAEQIAKALSKILEMDYEQIYNRITRNSQYEFVKRRIEKEQTDQIRQFIAEYNISGINLDEDSKRYYPYGNFASHVIGFTGDDNQGLNGIEMMFDKYLKGLPGRIVSAKNARGTEMPYRYERYTNPQDGANIVLTIDEVIQHFVEKHLETAVVENNLAKGGAAIVMDVNTGEILAMATKPDYDLNNPFYIQDAQIREMLATLSGDALRDTYNSELQKMWRNKAVVDTYEPGSTFKIFTSAAALEEGVVSTNDPFICTGSVKVGGAILKCWRHYRPHGAQTFAQGVQESCNPVFIEIGLEMGAQAFYRYVRAFGFRHSTGIELPGEAIGLFHQPNNFRELELATAAFGQGFQVTPLQMISAVAAVVNGGNLLKPQIIKQITDQNNTVIKTYQPEIIRQVISKETSTELTAILESVVSEGTGRNAYVKGYKIGGKTGTSEKLPRGSSTYVASFVGFAPADNPQVVAMVMLDEPEGEAYYGGVIAAPVIGKILEDILRYMGVEPVYGEDEYILVDVTVPEVRRLEIAEAKKVLKDTKLTYKIEGLGNTITDQIPKPGARLQENSMVILYTEEAQTIKNVIVPDVLGKTVVETNEILTNEGLNMRVAGYGTALRQQPEAGTYVLPGTVVEVEFRLMEVD